MDFAYAKIEVGNRGSAPTKFLNEIVKWANSAPDEIFAINSNKADIYAWSASLLGPWHGDLLRRRAGMCEIMRVHAGFESSWVWSTGADKTNSRSQANIECEETGIFQVSFDSTRLGKSAMLPFAQLHGIDTPRRFIEEMKLNHPLALEYYARLLRVSVAWAGPLRDHKLDSYLSRYALEEFITALSE